jgi:ketosteroid isomerase-like protein
VSEIESHLENQWKTYIEAVKVKDIDRALSIWTTDTRLLSDPGGTEDIKGRDGYRAIMEAAFPVLSVVEISLESDEILILDAESVMELGLWNESYTFEESGDTLRVYGTFVSLWKKQDDGQWRIHRFIRNRHDFVNSSG